jgi:YfiH family protein
VIDLLLYRKKRIIYGITLRNAGRWSARGWTALPAPDVTIHECISMRAALALQLGFASDALVIPNQVHGTTLAVVHANTPSEPADGLITSTQGLLLGVTLADCCGILIWAEDQAVIAAIHSGWRGTAGKIAQRCVLTLQERFGLDPSTLHAWLSPCASGQRYTVRADVAQYFPRTITPYRDEMFLFDNVAEIKHQLLEAGLNEQNISISGLCTIGDERFHSYRRDGERAGRMVAFIGILPNS